MNIKESYVQYKTVSVCEGYLFKITKPLTVIIRIKDV